MPFTFKNRQKAVAIFFMAGSFLLVVLSVLIAKQSDLITSKLKYYTIFTDAHGFSGGTNITYKGFKIGRITSLSLTKSNKIKADLYIFKSHARLIGPNTVLKVQNSLLGSSSLVLMTFDTFEGETDARAPETIGKEQQKGEDSKNNENSANDENNESDESDDTTSFIREKFGAKRKMLLSSDMPEGQAILKQRAAITVAGDELTSKVAILLDDIHSLKPELESTLGNISKSMEHMSVILAGMRGSGRTQMSDSVLAILRNAAETSKNLKDLSDALNSTDNSVGYLARDDKKTAHNLEKILTNMESITKDLKSFSKNTLGDEERMNRLLLLLEQNLVETRRLVKGMQKVFPYKEK